MKFSPHWQGLKILQANYQIFQVTGQRTYGQETEELIRNSNTEDNIINPTLNTKVFLEGLNFLNTVIILYRLYSLSLIHI